MVDSSRQFRVFISFSQDDRVAVERIAQVLEQGGLTPLWMKNFVVATEFLRQIMVFISHAHVFLPVITKESSRRGWVHEEIGYAKALNVPLFPLVFGDALPGQMMQLLNAVRVKPDLSGLEEQLAPAVFENLIARYDEPSLAHYECAARMEDRTEKMISYAKEIRLDMREHAIVRQKGALSSFHIPDKLVSDPAWAARYPDGSSRSEQPLLRLREERQELEKHARKKGCHIIINPDTPYEGSRARPARIRSLLEFLESSAVPDVQVAAHRKMKVGENVTILGDWFYAESVSAALEHGFRQTIFTRHAPSMQRRIDSFDDEFEYLLRNLGWTPENSRQKAIELLRATLREIEG